MTPMMINRVLNDLNVTYSENFTIWASHYLAITISCIFGSLLSNKIGRLNFLYLWVILGIVTSPLFALLSNLTVTNVLIISSILGISFGLGLPSCLAYFADHTLVENRGRISGIILLTTNLSAPLFVILFGMFNLIVDSIIFTAWRAFGLIVFFSKPEEKFASEKKNLASFISIRHDKSFILYFIAWLMFCFIDRLEKPIVKYSSGDFYYSLVMIEPIIGSVFAFIAGLISDWVGRKRVVLYGFVTLGIAYAIIGIAPSASVSWYFYLAIDSIAGGMLWVLFILIIWGDLSQHGTREKYYALGAIPYLLTDIVRLLSAPYVMLIQETSAFSLASFFLFLAILPLLYAPETLPERKIELRQLRKYVKAAKEAQQKHAERATKQQRLS